VGLNKKRKASEIEREKKAQKTEQPQEVRYHGIQTNDKCMRVLSLIQCRSVRTSRLAPVQWMHLLRL
jgi:hypothetical protein